MPFLPFKIKATLIYRLRINTETAVGTIGAVRRQSQHLNSRPRNAEQHSGMKERLGTILPVLRHNTKINFNTPPRPSIPRPPLRLQESSRHIHGSPTNHTPPVSKAVVTVRYSIRLYCYPSHPLGEQDMAILLYYHTTPTKINHPWQRERYVSRSATTHQFERS